MIKLAIHEAEQSTHIKARVGAVIFRKKSVLASAHNKPFAWSNRLAPQFRKWAVGIHAEAAAILSSRTDLRGAEILVVRIGRQGLLRMAKPCQWCWAYLQYVGIKSVTFTDENGQFTTMKI
jgi:tRNA(Arg) A34 adenosine deaminase TadA